MRPAAAALLALAVGVVAGCGGGQQRPAPRAVAPPAHRPQRVIPPVVPTLRPGQTMVAAVRKRAQMRATPHGPVLATVGRYTLFGSPQVLAVQRVAHGWVHVLHAELPPTGGWVPLRDVHLRAAAWMIDVNLTLRRARLLRNGRPFRAFTVGVGAPETPTPTGRFGVTDRLRAGPSTAYYGCCVLALTGHQPHVSQRWQGGDRLAFHGTDRPNTIGAAATLGCLHADEATMRLLVARVPLGTTVVIHN